MTPPESAPKDARALVAKAQEGDRQAQTELFADLYPAVRKHIDFVLGFRGITEDAVQESMVQIYRALPSFRGDSSPKTWALTIAARTARRHWRREARHNDSYVDSCLDEAAYAGEDTNWMELHALGKALGKLTLKKREVFVLMALFDYSARETAKILGIFTNTAASRYRHAKAELEQIYERQKEV